ncbi:uncharacterized protein CTHT_0038230 [Thermochaetoides thermophila DSM 1495]|uniref:Uncharacterized protein n=1 Tax=Chaetomium thermophilum (strain DSM 1495 / CBS 144.50 / IMI 039719) TaxID=759272 RepID=G0S8B3_CHATD|nr:hypothetical protein CTHT_0038230 [Thermochaetoides thermophila DSM 1495]EGS21947.1 hypothetical protein CTHT_0038230 [Thermochaetoides thermophila DSM 1495]
MLAAEYGLELALVAPYSLPPNLPDGPVLGYTAARAVFNQGCPANKWPTVAAVMGFPDELKRQLRLGNKRPGDSTVVISTAHGSSTRLRLMELTAITKGVFGPGSSETVIDAAAILSLPLCQAPQLT